LLDTKKTYGEFKPYSKSLVNNSNLSELISILEKKIIGDWPSMKISIQANENNCIDVVISSNPNGNQLGFQAYLNDVITNFGPVKEFKLQRIMSFWGILIGNNTYFRIATSLSLITKDQTILPQNSTLSQNTFYLSHKTELANDSLYRNTIVGPRNFFEKKNI